MEHLLRRVEFKDEELKECYTKFIVKFSDNCCSHIINKTTIEYATERFVKYFKEPDSKKICLPIYMDHMNQKLIQDIKSLIGQLKNEYTQKELQKIGEYLIETYKSLSENTPMESTKEQKELIIYYLEEAQTFARDHRLQGHFIVEKDAIRSLFQLDGQVKAWCQRFLEASKDHAPYSFMDRNENWLQDTAPTLLAVHILMQFYPYKSVPGINDLPTSSYQKTY